MLGRAICELSLPQSSANQLIVPFIAAHLPCPCVELRGSIKTLNMAAPLTRLYEQPGGTSSALSMSLIRPLAAPRVATKTAAKHSLASALRCPAPHVHLTWAVGPSSQAAAGTVAESRSASSSAKAAGAWGAGTASASVRKHQSQAWRPGI